MTIAYDVSKQKGSNRYYAHKTGTPKTPAGLLMDKKAALHYAADLCGMSYRDYMDMRRKQG